MYPDRWLLFLSVTLAVSASPGPLMLWMMANGARYGYFRSLPGMLGASAANLLLATLTAFGIGVALRHSTTGLQAIKWIGVLYLLYLGGRQLLTAYTAGSATAAARDNGDAVSMFARVFMVSISNPKGLVYFAALFPQFIDGNRALLPQFCLLMLTFLLSDFLWMSIYAGGGRAMAAWLDRRGHKAVLQRSCGALLIIAAIALAFA